MRAKMDNELTSWDSAQSWFQCSMMAWVGGTLRLSNTFVSNQYHEYGVLSHFFPIGQIIFGRSIVLLQNFWTKQMIPIFVFILQWVYNFKSNFLSARLMRMKMSKTCCKHVNNIPFFVKFPICYACWLMMKVREEDNQWSIQPENACRNATCHDLFVICGLD